MPEYINIDAEFHNADWIKFRKSRAGDQQVIALPQITLEWSDWYPWSKLKDSTAAPKILPKTSGVYEVRLLNSPERLTIGKSSNLASRITRGLVKGSLPHSAGKRIRANEDFFNLEVRWAETDRPCAVEEELHRMYTGKFGNLPRYTRRT